MSQAIYAYAFFRELENKFEDIYIPTTLAFCNMYVVVGSYKTYFLKNKGLFRWYFEMKLYIRNKTSWDSRFCTKHEH